MLQYSENYVRTTRPTIDTENYVRTTRPTIDTGITRHTDMQPRALMCTNYTGTQQANLYKNAYLNR